MVGRKVPFAARAVRESGVRHTLARGRKETVPNVERLRAANLIGELFRKGT